jgi:hypothetical protein
MQVEFYFVLFYLLAALSINELENKGILLFGVKVYQQQGDTEFPPGTDDKMERCTGSDTESGGNEEIISQRQQECAEEIYQVHGNKLIFLN